MRGNKGDEAHKCGASAVYRPPPEGSRRRYVSQWPVVVMLVQYEGLRGDWDSSAGIWPKGRHWEVFL